MTFDESYFATHYGDYQRQNPTRKLDWYLQTAERWTDAHPIRHLDVGCGLGAFVAHASTAGWVSHGSDVSEFGVNRARTRAPAADVQIAAAHDRPWPDDSFDVITVLDVLEHLERLDDTLDSIQAMLAPAGVLLAVMPVYDGPTGPVIRRLDKDPTHIHKWERDAWLDLLGARFDILDWQGAFRLLLPDGPYLHLPTRRLRRVSPAILIVARSN